ncbi:NAD(P)-binding protein [Rhizodiscina lignyota]|uniref:NAD(P)-binding protein n=1 Tax=Rhizodiscina lignyota TaxID=1504668 RepID=A0A9P4I5J7_9PEZI|nr:NAD(P)-binding protein [Rhizodiscina lignyota]
MAPQIKSVVIIGAGGNLGKGVLSAFLNSGLQVSVISRPESKSTFPPSVNVIKSTYDPAELRSAFLGQDALVCLISNFALADQKTIIDAAAAAGIQWFIPSEFGSNTTDKALTDYCSPCFDHKTETVKYARSKESAGMNWTAFITGFFFEWGLEKKFFGFDPESKSAEIWNTGNERFSTTNLPTIGKAIVNLLTSPEKLEACKNRYVLISSYTTTQNEVLKTFEKVTGEKWAVTHVDAEKRGKEGQDMLARGMFGLAAFQNVLLGAVYGKQQLGDHTKGKMDNDLLLPGNNEDMEKQLSHIMAELK